MSALHTLSLQLQRFVVLVGRVVAWAGLALMLVVLLDVITREMKSSAWISSYPALQQVFRDLDPYASSTKLQELEWHIHGVLFLLCFGYAYLKDAHVRIELARERLGMKTRAVIEMVGIALFLMPFCYFVIRFGYDFADRSYMRNEGSSALTGLPDRWIIKSFIPIGFVVMALAGLSVFLRCLVVLFGDDDQRYEAAEFLRDTEVHIDDDILDPDPIR